MPEANEMLELYVSPNSMSVATSPHKKVYRCPDCSREFGRLEHLKRHQLLHTHTPRPHQCPDCNRTFTRQDALHRHRSLHQPTHKLLTEQVLSNPRRKAAVFRSKQACIRCSKLKLKCNGQTPCGRCASRSESSCHYATKPLTATSSASSTSQRQSIVEQDEDEQQGEEGTSSGDYSEGDDAPDTSLGEQDATMIERTSDLVNEHPIDFTTPGTNQTNQSMINTVTSMSTTQEGRRVMIIDPVLEQMQNDDSLLDELETSLSTVHDQAALTSPNDLLPSSDYDWLFSNLSPASRAIQAPDSWAWSLFIDSQQSELAIPITAQVEMDAAEVQNDTSRTPLDILSSTALERQFDHQDQGTSPSTRLGTHRTAASALEPRDLRAPSRRNSIPGGATIKQWPNYWYPTDSDMRLNADFFANAPEDILLSENTCQVSEFDERAKSRMLSICDIAELVDREAEQVYAMLAGVSTATYNILVQLFFERFQPAYPFVHRATFHTERCNPLLLAAVCAVGTVYTRTPKAGNLGNVLIDLVDRAIILSTTRNNVHARSLSNIQALVLICIYNGSSGNRRLLEHTEAGRGAVTTMIRRCRLLDKVREPLTARPTNNVEDNETRWKTWLQWETGRRTGWVSFVSDMELSATWSLPPMFLLDELKTGLPCNEHLWEAPNADVWASAYRSSGACPTLDKLHEALSNSTLAREIDQCDLFQSVIVAHSISALGRSLWELSRSKMAKLVEGGRVELTSQMMASLASAGEQQNGISNNATVKIKRTTYEILIRFSVVRLYLDLHDLQALGGRKEEEEATMASNRLDALFDNEADLSHMLALNCARIIHLSINQPMNIACLSSTIFYAVVFLYAYSKSMGKKQRDDRTPGIINPPRITLEKVGDLTSLQAPHKLLNTMSNFFLTQLIHRSWPICKNLGLILSDMAEREMTTS